MKKFALIIFLAFGLVPIYAAVINSISANVGNYAITGYDIQKEKEFQAIGGAGKGDVNSAFKELVISYGLIYLADKSDKLKIREQEVDSYIVSFTNFTNANDPAAQFRTKLIGEYSQEYRLRMKKEQVIRMLLFYDQDFKAKVNQEIPEKEKRAFYQKNRQSLVDTPKVDLIVVGVVQPKNMSLDELSSFEGTLASIADQLKGSDDINSILKKKSLNVEPYSGRSGFKDVYELMRAGYPEEAMGIALKDSIPSSKGNITIKKGSAFFYPQPIPLRASGKPTYLIIKVIDRKNAVPMTFEKANYLIENRLKEEKIMAEVENYVAAKINKGELTVNIVDKNYEGALNELIRR
jgi:hypothetical protein